MATNVRPIRRTDQHLFDVRPIELEGFTLRARGVDVVGRPTIEQFAAAIDFAIGVESAGPFWIGSLWNYGESRKDWRDKLEQALAELHRPLVRKTLINYGYIDRTLSAKAKELAPTISHANVVVGLEPDEQCEFLERARSEAMTVRDLTQEVNASRRRKVLDTRAETMYTVEVTLWLEVEAPHVQQAQNTAWDRVKTATKEIGGKVIGATVRGDRAKTA